MDEHHVSTDEHTIYIDYAFAINVANTKDVIHEIISILESKSHAMNIAIDAYNSHLTENEAIAIAGKMLKPHLNSINTLYIVNTNAIQKIFFKTLFSLVGGKKSKYLRIMDSMDDVRIDVAFRWKNRETNVP
jgi:hypothetical protein